MVKANSNDKPEPVQFLVTLEPVNSFTTTDDLERKLRLMMAGCGIKTVSAEPVDDQDDETEAGMILL